MSGVLRAIGGEMELPSDALDGAPQPPPAGFVAVDSGRSALRLVARLLPRERSVLLPEYLCGSVVHPFAAERREVAFYAVGERLSVDADLLRERAIETDAAAVLAIDYFGFPLATPALASLPEDVVAIEDRSHGSLIEQGPVPPRRERTYRITSLRKYLPLPDGALADGPGLEQPPAGSRSLYATRARAKALRHEALARGGDEQLEREALALVARSEDALDAAQPEAIAEPSLALLARLDLRETMRRRRQNYAFLLEAFAHDPRLAGIAEPLLPSLPDGVSPLAFPLRVRGDRDRLRSELAERRVFCPVHWALPAGGAHASEAARRLSAAQLSLPIDQRYGEAEMAELADRLVAAGSAR